MNFSLKKFCYLLAQKKISLTALSRKSNIAASSLSRYAKGQIKPNPKNIGKLAEALNVNIDELID